MLRRIFAVVDVAKLMRISITFWQTAWLVRNVHIALLSVAPKSHSRIRLPNEQWLLEIVD